LSLSVARRLVKIASFRLSALLLTMNKDMTHGIKTTYNANADKAMIHVIYVILQRVTLKIYPSLILSSHYINSVQY
jgi:hypothetical protein